MRGNLWQTEAGPGSVSTMVARARLDDDPVLAACMSAPADDVPETDEERAAVEEGMAAIRAGRWIGPDEVRASIERRRLGG